MDCRQSTPQSNSSLSVEAHLHSKHKRQPHTQSQSGVAVFTTETAPVEEPPFCT